MSRSPSRRRSFGGLVAVAALAMGFGAPVQADDPLDPYLGNPGTTLPNLVPDLHGILVQGTFVFDEASQTFVPGPPALYLDAAAKNLGTVPLQLTADETTVSQCVSWRADHLCREQRPIEGLSSWSSYPGFATYELRAFLRNGRVDYSARGLLARNENNSLCLRDYERIAEDASPTPFYVSCSAVVQGISSGWLDKYDFAQPEQQLSLGDLPDGRYALVISMDNENLFHETDDGDNLVEVTLELSGDRTQVAVTGKRYP